MALPSLSDRMARTRRNQARALAGERGPIPAVEAAANDSTHGRRAEQQAVQSSRASLLVEFENLLPALSAYYSYAPQDIAYIRAAVTAVTPVGHAELALCVRQWRIEVVTYGLPGLSEDATMRAWIQFRQSVMGERTDENGVPYGPDALDCPLPVAGSAPQGRSMRP